jgi:hypothetical protein
MNIPAHIESLIKLHGSLRASARKCNLDPGNMSRLLNRSTPNPTKSTLIKLGLIEPDSHPTSATISNGETNNVPTKS